MRTLKLAAIVVASLALCAGHSAQAGVTIEAIGTPTWEAVDFHQFASVVGSSADSFAEEAALQASILPAPNHAPNADLGIGPGAPHAGPYTHEFADGLAALGIVDRSVYTASEFTSPNGINAVFMVVPKPGVIGRSPDFDSGPIIADALVPIQFTGPLFRDGVLYDQFAFTTDAPKKLGPLGFLDPSGDPVQGHSHIPFFFFESNEFAPSPTTPVAGSYLLDLRAVDQTGQGYRIQIGFEVLAVPEPASAMLLALGLLALGWQARRLGAERRRRVS